MYEIQFVTNSIYKYLSTLVCRITCINALFFDSIQNVKTKII